MNRLIFTLLLAISICSCDNDNRIKTYYESGQIQSDEGYSDNGKRNGKCIYYFEKKSVIKKIANYTNDSLNGELNVYYESGKIKSRSFWANGQQVDTTKVYYENGNIEGVQHFVKGKPYGLARFYYKDGTISKERFFKGDTLVSFKDFDNNGKIIKKSISFNYLNSNDKLNSKGKNRISIIIKDKYEQRDSLVILTTICSIAQPDAKVTFRISNPAGDTCLINYPQNYSPPFKITTTVKEYNNTISIFEYCDSLMVQ
jgi:MORN repeat variant